MPVIEAQNNLQTTKTHSSNFNKTQIFRAAVDDNNECYSTPWGHAEYVSFF
jgi:hypothetical protein